VADFMKSSHSFLE